MSDDFTEYTPLDMKQAILENKEAQAILEARLRNPVLLRDTAIALDFDIKPIFATMDFVPLGGDLQLDNMVIDSYHLKRPFWLWRLFGAKDKIIVLLKPARPIASV